MNAEYDVGVLEQGADPGSRFFSEFRIPRSPVTDARLPGRCGDGAIRIDRIQQGNTSGADTAAAAVCQV